VQFHVALEFAVFVNAKEIAEASRFGEAVVRKMSILKRKLNTVFTLFIYEARIKRNKFQGRYSFILTSI